ncbi:MAG: OmpH family outer membrane protein [Verrucomicrobiota bacterium]
MINFGLLTWQVNIPKVTIPSNTPELMMMKPYSVLLATIAGSLLAAISVNAETKIGLIDFARLQREFFKTDLERQSFAAKREEAREKVAERRAKLKELLLAQQDAEKGLKDPTTSESKKQEILEAARERVGQITALQKEAIELESRSNSELALQANEIQRSLTSEIYDMIGQLAAEKGLDLVFNRTFGINGVPTVAYSSTQSLEDFTDQISAKLNEAAPAGWTPPETGSGDINP